MRCVSVFVRPLCAAGAILLGASVSQAEIYRWVDVDGRTHYSNHKPRDAAPRQVTVIEDRLSVYTPDRGLTQAMETFRQQRIQAWELAALQRAYDAERRLHAPTAPAAYDEALLHGPAHEVFGHGVIAFPQHARRVPRLVQPELPPGRTAGLLVGEHGLVPGTTGFVPAPPPAVAAREPGAGHAGFTVGGSAAPVARGRQVTGGSGFTVPGDARPGRGGRPR